MMSMSLMTHALVEYHENHQEEIYLQDNYKALTEWLGQLPPYLKLSGEVLSSDFRKIMEGYCPKGKPLCQKPGKKHRPGIDLTLSPPKSVSVAEARAEGRLKESIRNAHMAAVKAAIRHLEEHAAYTRRGHDSLIHEPVVGFVVASFQHNTSRALDMQLHNHNIIANVAMRHDGNWGTIENRYLFLWQRSASAFYRAELAYQLMQLGFVLEPDGDAFHITGIPKRVCKHFSKRAKDIRAELDKVGIASSASAAGDMIKLDTRAKKQHIDHAELTERWHQEMDELGFTLDDLEQLIEHPPQQVNLQPSAWVFDEQLILDNLCERFAVFRKQDIYRVASELAQFSGESTEYVNDLVNSLLNHHRMVCLGQDAKYNTLYTTQAQLSAERSLVSAAKGLRDHEGFELDDGVLEAAIEQAESVGFTLSDEQSEAVHNLCTPHGFATLQGSAGAGKTASMQIVYQAYKEQGYRVIGAAVSKQAADTLATETKMETFTLAKLLKQIDERTKPLDEKTVLIIDEAGLLNSHDLAKLLQAASFTRCKVILSGEDKQLDAISHGGALRYLSQPEVLGTSRIETVRRQRDSWAREAVMQIRDGQALAALQIHDKKKLVHFACDNNAATAQLVARWQQYRNDNPDKQAVVLAQSWKQVRELSEQLRAIYQHEGSVSDENLTFDCMVSDKAMRFKFSVGERIRLTKNDYRKGLFNGTSGKITEIEQLENDDTRFTIETSDKRQHSFLASEYCDPQGRIYMAQAYAMTVYSSQGLTVDGDVFVLHNTGMDRATSYVAGSRHKDNCHWFFNQTSIEQACNNGESLTRPEALKAVAELMSQDRYKCMAIEYFDAQEEIRQREHELEVETEITFNPNTYLENEFEIDW